MQTKLRGFLLALSMCALPLCAEGNAFGCQGYLVVPESDLRAAVGGRLGFELGAHGAISLEGGAELRPRLDYTRLDGGAFSFSTLSSTTTVQGLSMGVDYVGYLDESLRGLFGVLGVNLGWWHTMNRFADDTRKTAPGILFGVGNRFNSALSLELDLNYGTFRSPAGAESSFNLGLLYRFSTAR